MSTSRLEAPSVDPIFAPVMRLLGLNRPYDALTASVIDAAANTSPSLSTILRGKTEQEQREILCGYLAGVAAYAHCSGGVLVAGVAEIPVSDIRKTVIASFLGEGETL